MPDDQLYSIHDCWNAVMERIQSEDAKFYDEKWLDEEKFAAITNDIYDTHRALRDHGSPKTDWFVTLKNTDKGTEQKTMRVKLDVYNTLKGL